MSVAKENEGIVNNYIAENIRVLRKSRGMSGADLARALNVSQTTISQWENGVKRPRFASLNTIAYQFGVTLDDLTKKRIDINDYLKGQRNTDTVNDPEWDYMFSKACHSGEELEAKFPFPQDKGETPPDLGDIQRENKEIIKHDHEEIKEQLDIIKGILMGNFEAVNKHGALVIDRPICLEKLLREPQYELKWKDHTLSDLDKRHVYGFIWAYFNITVNGMLDENYDDIDLFNDSSWPSK